MNLPIPSRASLVRVLLLASLVLAGGRAQAAIPETRSHPSIPERIRAVREALPAKPPLRFDAGIALARRAAPTSLSMLVVGCDFADSLMVGRDRSDFPGWPEGRRGSQVIPPATPDDPYGGTPIFAAHDSTYFDLQMQRVDDYFRTVSFGRLDLQWDVHGDIVNLPEGMGYYGDDDSSSVRAVRMAKQVVAAIDDDVDFSSYDTLVLIHAGAGQETDVNGDSPAQIFSNYLDVRDFENAVEADYLEQAFVPSDEAAIEHVLVLPEAQAQDPPESNGLAGFFDVRGVYAFEIGLRLGMLSLPDFTPSSFPDSQGIGNFGLMGFGLFTGLSTVPSAPSAMNRYLMGWVDPVDVTVDADLRIGAMDSVGAAVSDTLLVRVPINEREYWLVEYRLQDPDGDLFYSFPGKTPEGGGNGNNVPDYFDADSARGDGTPTSTFDPATDTWEDELGAEWDWFMSENSARTPDGCQRAGGSGLYIWHVDERVIQDAVLAGTNTINSDATRKGVDVEEADGIQDLDSLAGGLYLLGSDDDAWRGEGATEFGPDTLPDTRTNDGLRTGVRMFDVSTVVQDSLPKFEFQGQLFCSGFVYHRAMTFSVEFDAASDGPRELGRARTVGLAPDFDLRAADLGTSAADRSPDGVPELVAAADAGRVLAWRNGVEPFGITPAWVTLPASDGPRGAPAVVDVDGDDRLDVVVVGESALQAAGIADPTLVSGAVGRGVSAFLATPSESGIAGLGAFVRSGGTGTELVGLGPAAPDPTAAVLWTAEDRLDEAVFVTTDVAWVVGVRRDSTATTLLTFDVEGEVRRRSTLDAGVMPRTLAPVVFGDGSPAVTWVDGEGRLHLTAAVDPAAVPARSSLEAGLPASAPAVARASDGGPTVLAVTLGGALHVFDRNLRSLPGFPYRPERGGVEPPVGSRAVAPVLVDLDADGTAEVLWHEPAGSVHAVDLQGRVVPGWPVAGPAEPVSTPVVADLDGDGDLDLAVIGRFERLDSIDAPARDVETTITGDLRVFDLDVPVSAYAPWTQGGNGVDNFTRARLEPASGSFGADPGLVVYPNPTVDGRFRVRMRVDRFATVTVTVYSLEGQEVVSVGPVATPAGAFFEEEIELGDVAAGMYLCAVETEHGEERAVLTVVR
ncbi:MAG TPA: T9SS type A sorting domain-containing protein [Candidatus Krumholzibacteria bacterium]|nr:T9SS type A sorting domain-containing protein [Candidatus Krumholzibacteria bacterium]